MIRICTGLAIHKYTCIPGSYEEGGRTRRTEGGALYSSLEAGLAPLLTPGLGPALPTICLTSVHRNFAVGSSVWISRGAYSAPC
jgi:hypothetical protein